MQTYPDTLESRLEGTELIPDCPVMLLVSENRSTSLSSATYVPSTAMRKTKVLPCKERVRDDYHHIQLQCTIIALQNTEVVPSMA